MSGTAAQPVPHRPGWPFAIMNRQLDAYPDTGRRMFYLAITVLATITLYYELYVGGSVATLLLTNLHMSFTFYVIALAFGNLIGAFGSLFAGLTDRLGRANLVVFGLLFSGVFVAFILPTATDKWTFTIETFVVGFVEGVCLVATPALIRDFSPQVGRATAMGFWTSGPVVGSLIVAVVASATIPAVVTDPHFWTHEYRISGIAGLVVFVIAFIWLRELSPQLRDQLMVTIRDRALIEARAKGISEADIEAALRHPFRQLLKPDIIISAIAVSVMLLFYYTAVAFSVIYLNSVFGFSVKDATGLAIWGWILRVVVFASFLLIPVVINSVTPLVNYGATVSAYATQYKTELAFAQAHPAVVAAAQKVPPSVVATAQKIPPSVLATAKADATQLANAQKFAPELAVIQAHPALFGKLATYKNPAKIPAALLGQAIKAAGGGAKGIAILTTIAANQAAINGVIAVGPALQSVAPYAADLQTIAPYSAELTTMAPYSAQLTALSKVPPGVFAYLNAHGAAVAKAAAQTAGQWKTWYWICFGGIIFFLLSIPLLRGRWRPRDARRDEAEHEAKVQAELAKLSATV